MGSGVLAGLSDDELIERYCGNREDTAPINELYNRHRATMHRKLHLVVVLRGLCPRTWQRERFRDHCETSTYLNVLGRICRREPLGSLDGWLASVAWTTALDEFGKHVEDRTEPNDDGTEPPDEPPAGPWPGEPPATGSLDPYWWLKSSIPPPDAAFRAETREAMNKKRQEFVRGLLTWYAGMSDENAESIRFMRWHHWQGQSHQQIAAMKYGEAAMPQDERRNAWRVAKKISRDYRSLRRLLTQSYGITTFREVWRWLWGS